MLYTQDLLIPKLTTNKAPLRVTFKVTKGTVRRVWVRWRWGSANLCGARMLYHEFQHWPHAIGRWFPSTTHDLVFSSEVELRNEPFEIALEGYNEDDTYPHRVWVAFEIHREVIPRALAAFFDYFARRE